MIFAAGWDFSVNNYSAVWKNIIQIAILLVALLLGDLLRKKIPFLRKAFIPSALIGGFLLLICIIIFKSILGEDVFSQYIDKEFMQQITYHALGIGFAAMSLKTVKSDNKGSAKKVFENGAMVGSTYMLQAVCGLIVTIIFYYCTSKLENSVFYASGAILPLGYAQGPGNALTWDVNYSALLDANGNQLFTGNGSFGLTIASIGFLVASVFGVVYINIFKKKGEIKQVEQENIVRKVDEFEGTEEIPDSDSIDKFSVQIGLTLFVYLCAFGVMFLFNRLAIWTGVGLFNSVAWGFNFIWAVILANLLKLVLNAFKKKGVAKKNLVNNYQMDRISGFCFDLMIVAGVAAIDIEDVKRYVWPIVIICVVGAFATFFYIRLITKKRFKGYEHEMFLANFGTYTGTASNGMILLKEIDPNFKTPTNDLFIKSQLSGMIFVAPLLLLLDFIAKSVTNAIIGVCIFVVLFITYNIYIFADKIFKKK